MGNDARIQRIHDALEPFVADVRATLDGDFDVEVSINSDGHLEWSVYNTRAWAVVLDEASELPDLTATIAELIPDNAFDDVLEPWPRCPLHDDHPLMPEVRGGIAVWFCRRSGDVRIPIGSLTR